MVRILRCQSRYGLRENEIKLLALLFECKLSSSQVKATLVRLAKLRLACLARDGWRAVFPFDYYALDASAWFIPAGLHFTSPAPGVVSVSALPDCDEPGISNRYIGATTRITTGQLSVPEAGMLKGKDVLVFFRSRKFTLGTTSRKEIAAQLVRVGQFGWLKAQHIDNGRLVFACELWVRCDALRFRMGLTEFRFTVMPSNLNVLEFFDATAQKAEAA